MPPTYPSALCSLQREVQKGNDSGKSLGHSTKHLESDGGRKGGRDEGPEDEETATTTAGLQDGDGATRFYERRCPPRSRKAYRD